MPALNLPDHHRTTLRGRQILVVEDEALIAMMAEQELLGAGARVVGPAMSVGEALRLIEGAASDGGLSAAVLDLNLNGEAVSPVADRLASLGVPFLFATGYDPAAVPPPHGAVALCQKPIDPQIVARTLFG